jgi:dTDP-4-dehydrorhamnose reductase
MSEDHERSTPPLELWGGVECTVVRIGDHFRDQIVETGHSVRLADLDAIAELGIRTVRYPIVWERVAPDEPDRARLRWHDERLRRLRDLGIRVIGGLVHHGSGPRYTSLLDPEFGTKLGAMRRRSPSAIRGSTLDPGQRAADHRPLRLHVRALVSAPAELRRLRCWRWRTSATARSRRCGRSARSIPHACTSRPRTSARPGRRRTLAYQARHENERRWLSLDLLAGRVDEEHPFRNALRKAGVSPTRCWRTCAAARRRPTSSGSTIT